MSAELHELPVDKITPNPENPRQIFRPAFDERLSQSIDSSGVLVPVYVYPEGDGYRLIDGERRWTQARRLGLATIPALVRAEAPDAAENIVEMFNIHLVRAQWEDMPTARALAKVMDRIGSNDLDELKKTTGLSKEKIKDYQLILDLPEQYQQLIWDGLPMNFFVELEENVIRPLARQRPALSARYPADDLRNAFLAKRDSGALTDVVELRRMRHIIREAAEDAGGPAENSDIDVVVERLITDADSSIEEAYTEVALARVELQNFTKLARSLISAVDRLVRVSDDGSDQQGEIRDAIVETISALRARLDALPES